MAEKTLDRRLSISRDRLRGRKDARAARAGTGRRAARPARWAPGAREPPQAARLDLVMKVLAESGPIGTHTA